MSKDGLMVNNLTVVKRMIKALLLLAMLSVAQSEVWAETFVCVKLDGKKIFSTIACEKRGLKAGSADFPVIEAQQMQQAQPFFILTPESEAQVDRKVAIPAASANLAINANANGNQIIKKNPRPDIWKEPLKIGGIGLVILILMPIASSFFLGYYVFMYFRRRTIKLQDFDLYAAKE
jgi:hypothetical protein